MEKLFLTLLGVLFLQSPCFANIARLNLSDRTVSVYDEKSLIATFPVAVGKAAYPTPMGQFTVKSKIYKPGWVNPFTGEVRKYGYSPLGIGWLGFANVHLGEVGFHGTLPSMRGSIGTAGSHGCVRLYDEDMEKLFSLLDIGDKVIVVQ